MDISKIDPWVDPAPPGAHSMVLNKLRQKIDKKEPWASRILAERYQDGKGGVKQSSKFALDIYKLGAKQGDPKCMNHLGCMYRKGQGVDMNETLAFEHYEKAALKGYDMAQLNVGHCYRYGIHVGQSYSKAREWYNRAAAQGCKNTNNHLNILDKLEKEKRPTSTTSNLSSNSSKNSNPLANLFSAHDKSQTIFGVDEDLLFDKIPSSLNCLFDDDYPSRTVMVDVDDLSLKFTRNGTHTSTPNVFEVDGNIMTVDDFNMTDVDEDIIMKLSSTTSEVNTLLYDSLNHFRLELAERQLLQSKVESNQEGLIWNLFRERNSPWESEHISFINQIEGIVEKKIQLKMEAGATFNVAEYDVLNEPRIPTRIPSPSSFNGHVATYLLRYVHIYRLSMARSKHDNGSNRATTTRTRASMVWLLENVSNLKDDLYLLDSKKFNSSMSNNTMALKMYYIIKAASYSAPPNVITLSQEYKFLLGGGVCSFAEYDCTLNAFSLVLNRLLTYEDFFKISQDFFFNVDNSFRELMNMPKLFETLKTNKDLKVYVVSELITCNSSVAIRVHTRDSYRVSFVLCLMSHFRMLGYSQIEYERDSEKIIKDYEEGKARVLYGFRSAIIAIDRKTNKSTIYPSNLRNNSNFDRKKIIFLNSSATDIESKRNAQILYMKQRSRVGAIIINEMEETYPMTKKMNERDAKLLEMEIEREQHKQTECTTVDLKRFVKDQRKILRKKEEERRRQLGFNKNNPWSLEKENRLKEENEKQRRQQLGFNANNPWSQQKENRLKEENKEKQKQLFASSTFLAAVARTTPSSTQKFQLNELPLEWETQENNSGKCSYVSPDGKRFSSLKKVGLYLSGTLNDVEMKQLWTPTRKLSGKQ